MSKQHCIVIGGGHAAVQLSVSLRQYGWQGDITMVSAEIYPPYQRPPLSKAYLGGSAALETLYIRPPAFYEKHNITLKLGVAVTAIDRHRRQVSLDDGSTLAYTRLALTTGAKAKTLPLPGSTLKGVCYLRNLDDVLAIKPLLKDNLSVAIIGGGYIGLEAAATFRKLGLNVTVVECMPRILQRVTAPEVSDFFTRVHREEGVTLLTHTSVQQIEGAERVSGIRFADGTSLQMDLVMIGVGIEPETTLAATAGLKVNDGIWVNDYAQTSDPDIVAAGDCTVHFNPIYKRHLRLESVQNATDQARVAAATLCGKLAPYRALPWFWSDQYDIKLQIAGLSQGFDLVVIRGDIHQGRCFSAFYFAHGQLIAVDAINQPKTYLSARRALTEGCLLTPERAADESVAISDLF